MGVRAILAALPSVISDMCNKEAYRAYTAECLRVLTENTAKYAGGSSIQLKYTDMINRKPRDARSGEEIAADVIKKCGLKVVSE